jgi:nucleoside-diphosphate-sugar epimerase
VASTSPAFPGRRTVSLRVLITGATGFIGSHVARLAVEQGAEVCLVIRPESNTWRIRDLLSNVRTWPGDLTDSDAIHHCVSQIRPNLCIHLAWFAEPITYWHSVENLASLAGSLSLVRELIAAGCQRLVAIGTCAEYDWSGDRLAEDSPVIPHTLYAATKASLASILEQFNVSGGLQSAWLRLFWQHGPYEDARRLVPYLIQSLLRREAATLQDASRIVDFLHVSDVAAAIWAVAISSVTGSVNVGSANPVSVGDVATTIADLIGARDLLRAASASAGSPAIAVYADNRRLLESTSWQPHYGLQAGLAQTISWWQENMGGPAQGDISLPPSR